MESHLWQVEKKKLSNYFHEVGIFSQGTGRILVSPNLHVLTYRNLINEAVRYALQGASCVSPVRGFNQRGVWGSTVIDWAVLGSAIID